MPWCNHSEVEIIFSLVVELMNRNSALHFHLIISCTSLSKITYEQNTARTDDLKHVHNEAPTSFTISVNWSTPANVSHWTVNVLYPSFTPLDSGLSGAVVGSRHDTKFTTRHWQCSLTCHEQLRTARTQMQLCPEVVLMSAAASVFPPCS